MSSQHLTQDAELTAVTFISFSIILTSMLIEFIDYRRIHLEPSIEVDRSRGEKLVIEMDITFPRVPCYCQIVDSIQTSPADPQYYPSMSWTSQASIKRT